MSRGFVKEDDQEEVPMVPPRAYLPPGVPNYVTRAGMDALLEERESLIREKEELDTSNEKERRIAVNHILMNGYSIENMNERLLTLRTHYKSAATRGSNMATDVALTASAVEVNETTVIMLFGSFRQGMRLPTAPNLGESRIYHFGQTGSMARVAWNEMYNIASTFSQNLIFDTR